MDQSQKELDKALGAIHNQYVLINHLYSTKEATGNSYYALMNENTKKLITQLSDLSLLVANRYKVIFKDWPDQ